MHALVENVAKLMSARGLTSHAQLAKHAKFNGYPDFSPRTVGNLLTYGKTHETSPTVRKLQGVAEALQVPLWTLFVPGLKEGADAGHELHQLMEAFLQASAEGRTTILRIAQNEARLGRGPESGELAVREN